MWIKGLSGSFFRGFPGTQEISAFHFQDTSGGFAQVSGPNGAQFKPYSAPYEAFGQTLISGEVTSATGQTLGYEVYSLDTKTSTVSLFSDIEAGDRAVTSGGAISCSEAGFVTRRAKRAAA